MAYLSDLEALLARTADADVIDLDAPPLNEPVSSNMTFAIDLGRMVARTMEPRAVNTLVLRFEGGHGAMTFHRSKGWALDVDLTKLALNKPTN